jgi:RAMP superfamily
MPVLATMKTTIRILGPLLTRASEPGPIGVDLPAVRNRAEEPILPFSLVRGRLRQSFEELVDLSVLSCDLGDLFGVYGSEKRWDPRRGRLMFSDFTGQGGTSETIPGIRIDRDRMSVARGALWLAESPVGSGVGMPFTGEIRWFAPDEGSARETFGFVQEALRWAPSYGGERTVGFGRVADVHTTLDLSELRPLAPEEVPETQELHLVLRLRDPFCLAALRLSDNLFESTAVIPGAAVRGTIASMVQQALGLRVGSAVDGGLPEPWADLGAAFDSLRFSHFLPVPADARTVPVTPPLSLAFPRGGDKNSWVDAALLNGPFLLDGQAPVFEPDWKEQSGWVGADFGWPDPSQLGHSLRVRTAVARATGRADDKRLFAHDMIEPNGFEWHGQVALPSSDPDSRRRVWAGLLGILRGGLVGLGKTKAGGEVVRRDLSLTPAVHEAPDPFNGSTWVVTLQTPALLADPQVAFSAERGELALGDAYRGAFDQLSLGRLRLVRWFTRETLTGGYLVSRFQGSKPYNPFLLTEAGSTFVFEEKPDAPTEAPPAADIVDGWRREGLQPEWVRELYGAGWRENPYRPEDGYGAVVVNLECHRKIPEAPESVGLCQVTEAGREEAGDE